MKDTLSIIIATILLVILLIILPLYNYFERQDDMSYNVALKSVTALVDEVTQNGYLDQTIYDKFIDRLAQTGNTYDIEIEAQKRIITFDPNSEEERFIEQYKSYFNKDIFNSETGHTSNIIDTDNSLKNDIFFLDEGDRFSVRIKNTNTTMASAILSSITTNVPTEKIDISYGAIVKNNNWKNTVISQIYQKDIVVTVKLENPNTSEPNNDFPKYNFENAADRLVKYRVTVNNADDTDVKNRIMQNIRLVGDNPNCYLSPSGISTDGEDYIISFELDYSKKDSYFRDNEYNVLQCFLPANSIQGTFSKNNSASSQKIVYVVDDTIEVPEL